MFRKLLYFLLFTFSIKLTCNNKADLIVFSYNRAMQLDLFLESKEKYITNLGETHIVYRADQEHASSYEEVKKRYQSCIFHKQGNDPYSDFKPITIKAIFNSPSEYVIFAVDDIVTKDFIDIAQCVQALKDTGAYAFFLRLGLNITESYMCRMLTPVPKYSIVSNDICIYSFKEGKGEWCYPNNLDMTLYKKEEVKADLLKIDMFNPFYFELYWDHLSNLNKKGLFFKTSKIVNVPLNLCYENSVNRSMKMYSMYELLEKYNAGFKIDLDKFCINNKSPHAEHVPEFVKR